mgnify:FL=1
MKGMAYCDYIAYTLVKPAIGADAESLDGLIESVSGVKMDLHKEEGYMLSTKKTIECTDKNGKKYKITIEEI